VSFDVGVVSRGRSKLLTKFTSAQDEMRRNLTVHSLNTDILRIFRDCEDCEVCEVCEVCSMPSSAFQYLIYK